MFHWYLLDKRSDFCIFLDNIYDHPLNCLDILLSNECAIASVSLFILLYPEIILLNLELGLFLSDAHKKDVNILAHYPIVDLNSWSCNNSSSIISPLEHADPFYDNPANYLILYIWCTFISC